MGEPPSTEPSDLGIDFSTTAPPARSDHDTNHLPPARTRQSNLDIPYGRLRKIQYYVGLSNV
jgi:hypothetical protein